MRACRLPRLHCALAGVLPLRVGRGLALPQARAAGTVVGMSLYEVKAEISPEAVDATDDEKRRRLLSKSSPRKLYGRENRALVDIRNNIQEIAG